MALSRIAAYSNRTFQALSVFVRARGADAPYGQLSWEPDVVENDYYRFRNLLGN